jgi:succinylarginine dihydrolase
MRNGGGPACLRLRVVLSEQEAAAADQQFILDDAKISALETLVKAHYRDRILPEDLADPALMDESFAVMQALTDLLGMGGSILKMCRIDTVQRPSGRQALRTPF